MSPAKAELITACRTTAPSCRGTHEQRKHHNLAAARLSGLFAVRSTGHGRGGRHRITGPRGLAVRRPAREQPSARCDVATQLAQEVAERIRANRAGALGSTSNYNDVAITKTSAFTETTCGTPTDATGCSTPAAMRNYDIYKLYQRITTNNGNPPILTGGAIRI